MSPGRQVRLLRSMVLYPSGIATPAPAALTRSPSTSTTAVGIERDERGSISVPQRSAVFDTTPCAGAKLTINKRDETVTVFRMVIHHMFVDIRLLDRFLSGPQAW